MGSQGRGSTGGLLRSGLIDGIGPRGQCKTPGMLGFIHVKRAFQSSFCIGILYIESKIVPLQFIKWYSAKDELD